MRSAMAAIEGCLPAPDLNEYYYIIDGDTVQISHAYTRQCMVSMIDVSATSAQLQPTSAHVTSCSAYEYRSIGTTTGFYLHSTYCTYLPAAYLSPTLYLL